MTRAHLALEAGDTATFDRFRSNALDLRRRFNEDFWIDEHGWFALALDDHQRPVDVLASNMGHCLWTGIIEPERAAVVAERLMSPAMFSGFGVRTPAATATAFNPVSYHNGSVWPHDNALCAAGLARYGYIEDAHRIITAQIDVARHHHGRFARVVRRFRPRRVDGAGVVPGVVFSASVGGCFTASVVANVAPCRPVGIGARGVG